MGKSIELDEEGLPIPQKVKVAKSSIDFDDEGLPIPKKKEISSSDLLRGVGMAAEGSTSVSKLGSGNVTPVKQTPKQQLSDRTIWERFSDQNNQNDPVKNYLDPLRSRKKEITETSNRSESTGQDKVKKLALSNEVNNINQAEFLVKKDLFPTRHEAKVWLARNPDADKNETSAIAKKIVDDDNLATAAIAKNGGNLKKAAIDYYASKDNQIGEHLRIMQRDGVEIPRELEGELVHGFLNNRTVTEGSKENRDVNKAVLEQSANFYKEYPELHNKMLLTKIAKGREDLGYNNWFANIPGVKSSDEIVNTLAATGQLTQQDIDYYNKVTRKMIGAGVADIPTPGLLEKTLQGTANTIGNIPKAVYELSLLRDALHSDGEILAANLQEDLDKTPEPAYKGLAHKLSSATGDLLGVVAPIGLQTKALTGLNILKNGAAASEFATGLSFYHDIQKEESKRNPDDPFVAHLSALLQSAVWMKGTKLFGNLSKDLIKSSSPEINQVLKSLKSGEIDNAIAAQDITKIVADKAAGVIGSSAKESGKIAGITVLNKTISDILNGENHLSENISQGVNTFEHMMMGLPLLEVAKTAGAKNMTADYLDEMAKNPEAYREKITSPAEKKNFEYLLEVNKTLEGREDLKPEQKKKVQLIELQKKILDEKIKSSPSDNLVRKETRDRAILEIEGQKELEGMGNTDLVKEFFDNELLGKSSLENLSVRDAEGRPTNKFDPSKVGEYLKEAAQRLNNLDSEWKPNKVGDSSEAAKEAYPDAIAEIANERWKKEIEAAKPAVIDQERELDTGVKVTMPEENKSPDIVPLVKESDKFETVRTTEASNEEPPLPKGETIVTLSGMTDGERQRKISERQGRSGISEDQKLENDFADLAWKANQLTYNSKADAQSKIRQRVREENAKAGYEKYKYSGVHILKRRVLRKGSLKGRSIWKKVSSVNNDIGNQSIKKDGIVLRDRGVDLQNNFDNLVDIAPLLEVKDANGRNMSKDQIDLALQDVYDGIPSVQAESLLNTLETALKNDDFPVKDNFVNQQVRINDLMGVKSEIIGEPLTEDAIKDWLNDESKLTREQEDILNSEFQNILNEYPEIEIEVPVSETKSRATTTSSKTVEPEIAAIETPKEKVSIPEQSKVTYYAGEFSGKKGQPVMYLTESKDYAKKYGDKVVEYEFTPKKTLDKSDLGEKDLSFEDLKSELKKDDINVDESIFQTTYDTNEMPFWMWARKYPEIMNAIREKGYDSIKHGETHKGQAGEQIENTTVALNPSDVKTKSETQKTAADETVIPEVKEANQQSEQQAATESPTVEKPDTNSGGAEPPKGAPNEKVVTGSSDIGGITHAANEVRRKDRLLPEYEKTPQTFEQWNNEAEKKILEGYDVKDLITRIEKGHDPTPVENAIRKIYVATLDAEIAKNPTDALLKEQKRFVEAGDLANSRAGRNLVSLKGQGSPLETISDFYVAKMEAAGVDRLTEQQKKETAKAFYDVQRADENATAAMEAYREEIAKLKAENELLKAKKETKKPAKKEHTDFVTERKKIAQSIAEKWKKAGNDGTLSSDIPFRKQLAAIAPDVAKLMKSYIEEGIVKLEEIVKKVHDELKDVIPNLQEKDIHDIIAGEYNEKKATRNELAATMRDLRDEAYYINKLERLLNGTEPKNEKQKVKRNQQITELQKKIKDFQKAERDALKEPKEEVDADVAKLAAIKKRNEKQTEEIKERIAKGEFEKEKKKPFLEDPEMQKKFPKEYNAALDAIKKREDARHEFDITLLRDQMSRRTTAEKATDLLSKSAGTVKAITTGIDDSAVAIQTYMSLLTRPRTGAKAFYQHIRQGLSQKKFDRWLTALHSSADFKEMKDMGLDVTEPSSLIEREKEEIFNNRFNGTVKIKGNEYKLIDAPLRPFERAFTTLGNVTRVVGYRTISAKYKREGFTPEKNPKLFESLATRLNTETGRGNVNEYVDKANKVITMGIWSPKLMATKFNILGVSDLASIFLSKAGTKGYYRQLHPKERLQAIADVAQFATTVMATSYGLALAFGGDVDNDPLSSTFLDVKMPNGKSYNFSGGFSGYIRAMSQFIMGKKSQNGNNVNVGRLETGGRFFRGKVPPLTGSILNLAAGKDFMGQPTSVQGEAVKLLPISLQGIYQQIKNDGAESFFTQGIPTFFGLNVKNEKDYPTQTMKVKDPETFKEYNITEDQQKKFNTERDKRYEENLKAFTTGNETIYIDVNGKLHIAEPTTEESKTWEEITPDKLSKDQRKQLESKVKARSTREIKKDMFGDGTEEIDQD